MAVKFNPSISSYRTAPEVPTSASARSLKERAAVSSITSSNPSNSSGTNQETVKKSCFRRLIDCIVNFFRWLFCCRKKPSSDEVPAKKRTGGASAPLLPEPPLTTALPIIPRPSAPPPVIVTVATPTPSRIPTARVATPLPTPLPVVTVATVPVEVELSDYEKAAFLKFVCIEKFDTPEAFRAIAKEFLDLRQDKLQLLFHFLLADAGYSVNPDGLLARYFNAAKALIELGANPRAKDSQGKTPMHLVSHYVMFALLLGNGGADDINTKDHQGRSPLATRVFYLCINGTEELDASAFNTVKALIENGANVNDPMILLKDSRYIRTTLLHVIIGRCHMPSWIALFDLVLDKADLTAINERGKTALQLAESLLAANKEHAMASTLREMIAKIKARLAA